MGRPCKKTVASFYTLGMLGISVLLGRTARVTAESLIKALHVGKSALGGNFGNRLQGINRLFLCSFSVRIGILHHVRHQIVYVDVFDDVLRAEIRKLRKVGFYPVYEKSDLRIGMVPT